MPIEDLLTDRGRRRYVGVIRDFLEQYRASLNSSHRALIDGYRYVHMAGRWSASEVSEHEPWWC